LIPLVDLDYVCALFGVEQHDLADAEDVALLRDLLAGRAALGGLPFGDGCPPHRPRLRIVC
jgi:hypothetical protein